MTASESESAAIAVLAAAPDLRLRLERAVDGRAGLNLAGAVADPVALAALIDHARVDLVLAEPAASPWGAAAWYPDQRRVPFAVLIDATDRERALDAFEAGACAVLPHSAGPDDIAAAAAAARRGLRLLPDGLLHLLLRRAADAGEPPDRGGASRPELTERELDVLAALADGASNKAIARRLGISFHTVKFHVAAILAKLGAESRTEAVAQAARRGLVML